MPTFVSMTISEEQIWTWLNEVRDPEIPVISIVELGVLKKVQIKDNHVLVTITPTYSGCPAMRVMEEDIIAKLQAEGIANVQVEKAFAPAWTTDDISASGREKMKQYGIAPPNPVFHAKKSIFDEDTRIVACPRCNGKHTEMRNFFGSTSCKSLYYCNDCHEPFEYFKCL